MIQFLEEVVDDGGGDFLIRSHDFAAGREGVFVLLAKIGDMVDGHAEDQLVSEEVHTVKSALIQACLVFERDKMSPFLMVRFIQGIHC